MFIIRTCSVSHVLKPLSKEMECTTNKNKKLINRKLSLLFHTSYTHMKYNAFF